MDNFQEASLPQKNINTDFRSQVDTINDALAKARQEENNFIEFGMTVMRKFGVKNVSFKYRIKKPERIHAKMLDKGYHPSQIHDILAGLFECRDKTMASSVAKWIYNKYKDKIINFERKMEGMGKPGDRTGYQDYSEAFHINLNLNGLAIEVQIMTKAASRLKDFAHENYKQVRVGGELDPELARMTALGFRKPERQKAGPKPVEKFNPRTDFSFSNYVRRRDTGD